MFCLEDNLFNFTNDKCYCLCFDWKIIHGHESAGVLLAYSQFHDKHQHLPMTSASVQFQVEDCHESFQNAEVLMLKDETVIKDTFANDYFQDRYLHSTRGRKKRHKYCN